MKTKELKQKHIENLNKLNQLKEKFGDCSDEYSKSLSQVVFKDENGDLKDVNQSSKFFSQTYYGLLLLKYTTQLDDLNKLYNDEFVPNIANYEKYKKNEKIFEQCKITEDKIKSLENASKNATKIETEIEEYEEYEPYVEMALDSPMLGYVKKERKIEKEVPDEFQREVFRKEAEKLQSEFEKSEHYDLYKEQYPKLLKWQKIVSDKQNLELDLKNKTLLSSELEKTLTTSYKQINEIVKKINVVTEEINNFVQKEYIPVQEELLSRHRKHFLAKNEFQDNWGENLSSGNTQLIAEYSLNENKNNLIDTFVNKVQKGEYRLKEGISKEEIKDLENQKQNTINANKAPLENDNINVKKYKDKTVRNLCNANENSKGKE